jgi:hypothetical protein
MIAVSVIGFQTYKKSKNNPISGGILIFAKTQDE